MDLATLNGTLPELGAIVIFGADAFGNETTAIAGIHIPYDWKGDDSSLELIREIPLGENDHPTLALLGPTTLSQEKIDAISTIPGWTIERAPAVFLGIETRSREVTVKVFKVLPGSAADKSGITKGDVITQVGEIKVQDLQSFRACLLDKKPGDEITITLSREGVEKRVVAKLSPLPEID